VPSVSWVPRSRMKFRSIRGPNWVDARVRVTRMIEKTTPTTVMTAAPSTSRLGTHVTMILLEHPEGMLLCLHQPPDPSPAWHELGSDVAVLSFRVGSRADLAVWNRRLAELDAEHSSPRQAHLGWALDVIDPSGLRIQLHTHEAVSADDT